MSLPTVYVVDDDAAVRKAVAAAGGLLGHPVRAFASAAAFLADCSPALAGCLVLDVKMPGTTGLELQRRLADDGITLPVVMISGHADVRIAVEAMTLGAITLLEKPFSLDELLGHVRKAMEQDEAARAARGQQDDTRGRLALLTPKEREVVEHIVAGRTNREIADVLGVTVRAVEDRRARLMRRVGVSSVAELVALATAR